MSKIMLANIKQEFIFNIIDPAIKPSKPESNNAIVIAFAGFFLGIIFGSFFAVFVDKTKDDKNL